MTTRGGSGIVVVLTPRLMKEYTLRRFSTLVALGGMAALTVLGGRALIAADKATVQVPGGLAMSEFKGYEDWSVVATSETDELMKVMVANPTMIAAYKAGIPLNGKPFPEGSTIVKIEWTKKKNPVSPFEVKIPDTLKDVLFITKDSKRFAASAGWGYSQFNHDGSGGFSPEGSGSACGHVCHTIVKAQDFIFTAYGRR
jgi:Cytochrome P460